MSIYMIALLCNKNSLMSIFFPQSLPCLPVYHLIAFASLLPPSQHHPIPPLFSCSPSSSPPANFVSLFFCFPTSCNLSVPTSSPYPSVSSCQQLSNVPSSSSSSSSSQLTLSLFLFFSYPSVHPSSPPPTGYLSLFLLLYLSSDPLLFLLHPSSAPSPCQMPDLESDSLTTGGPF